MNRLFMLTIAGLLMATACAPRQVRSITGTETQVKFTYTKEHPFDPETGIAQCDRNEDGTLSNCRYLDIVFHEGD